MKKQDEIEELFSSTFVNFESMPPLDVKSAIDDQLFNGKPPVSDRKKGFIWIFSSIILIGIVSFFAFKSGGNDSPVLAKNETSIQEKSTTNSKLVTQKNEHHKEISQSDNQNSKKEIITQFDEQKLTQEIELKANITSKKTSKLENDSKLEGNKIISKKQKTSRLKTAGTNTKTANSVKNNESESTSKELKNDLSISISQIEKKDNPIDKSEIPRNSIFSNEVVEAKNESIEKSNNFIDDTLNKNENSVAENVEIEDTTTLVKWSEATGTSSAIQGIFGLQLKALSPWSISIYSGGTFGTSILKNSTTENYKMKEQLGFSTSLEANYRLNSRLGVSAGIDLNSRKDIFYRIIPAGDSILAGYTTQYIFSNPVTQDTLIDSLVIPNYVIQPTSINQEQIIQQTSFAIPIFMSINLLDQNNWKMFLNTGLRFSYVQNKLISSPLGMIEPEFKSFGLRVNMRPEVTYSFKKVGIGCYLNLGYDAIPSMQWADVKRARIDYGFGLVLKYHF